MRKPLLPRTLLTNRERLYQIAGLYGALLFGIILSFLTSILNTRSLGPAEYGDYKFINNIFFFASTISTLGLFTTGSQIIAGLRAHDRRNEDIMGAIFVAAGLISGVFVLLCMGFASVQPMVFTRDLRSLIMLFSPLVIVAILQPCLEGIYQGANQIHELSMFRLIPPGLFLGSLWVYSKFQPLHLEVTLSLQLGAGVLATLFFVQRLHPKFKGVFIQLRKLWRYNREYGWHVYIGILSNVATAYLATFVISYFVDNTNVGFFSLALTITMPLTQISSVVGTTYFKDFAHSPTLPQSVTRATIVMAAVILLAFIALIRPIVLIFYTGEFAFVATLAMIISVGATAHGLGDYYNRFLGAHGRGKDLRNGAMMVGIVNIVGYLGLVPFLGAIGAAITRLLAGLTYCGMMAFYYRRSLTASKVNTFAITNASLENTLERPVS